jgi:hypothetical protein
MTQQPIGMIPHVCRMHEMQPSGRMQKEDGRKQWRLLICCKHGRALKQAQWSWMEV